MLERLLPIAIRTNAHRVEEAVANVDEAKITELLAGVGDVVVSHAERTRNGNVLQGGCHERRNGTREGFREELAIDNLGPNPDWDNLSQEVLKLVNVSCTKAWIFDTSATSKR